MLMLGRRPARLLGATCSLPIIIVVITLPTRASFEVGEVELRRRTRRRGRSGRRRSALTRCPFVKPGSMSPGRSTRLGRCCRYRRSSGACRPPRAAPQPGAVDTAAAEGPRRQRLAWFIWSRRRRPCGFWRPKRKAAVRPSRPLTQNSQGDGGVDHRGVLRPSRDGLRLVPDVALQARCWLRHCIRSSWNEAGARLSRGFSRRRCSGRCKQCRCSGRRRRCSGRRRRGGRRRVNCILYHFYQSPMCSHPFFAAGGAVVAPSSPRWG